MKKSELIKNINEQISKLENDYESISKITNEFTKFETEPQRIKSISITEKLSAAKWSLIAISRLDSLD